MGRGLAAIRARGRRSTRQDFATLGADVTKENRAGYGYVLTRLHARYGKDIKDDLVFKAAQPIVGGREIKQRDRPAREHARSPRPTNNFQGRYAIRHPWTGPITCEKPQRGHLGRSAGRTDAAGPAKPALGLAFAPRGQVELAQALAKPDPRSISAVVRLQRSRGRVPTAPPRAAPCPPSPRASPRTGCGCDAGGRNGLGTPRCWSGRCLLLRRRKQS